MAFLSPLNPPVSHWTGQRVWIVGASSGIGAELARQLAQRGAWLALSARRQPELGALAASLPEPAHAASLVLPCDVTDPDAVAESAGQLCAAWDGVDLVVFAAGIYDAQRSETFDASGLPSVRLTLDTNLMGAYHVLAATLPTLLRQGRGGLAFLSSVAGYGGLPRALAYAPGKAALNNLCEGLFLELRPRGLAVYRICPGFVATPMTEHNDFRMPALIPAAEAAREIILGLERGDFHIHFPRRFTRLLRLLQCLPRRIYFRLLREALRRA